MVTEVMSFPMPRAVVKFSSPIVHSAIARGTRWKESPKPRTTAMMPKRRYCLLPPLRIMMTPSVMTVIRYTVSNKVSTIACMIFFLSFFLFLLILLKLHRLCSCSS